MTLLFHATVTSFVPSAEEATEYQERFGALVVVHVNPESVDVLSPTQLILEPELGNDSQFGS